MKCCTASPRNIATTRMPKKIIAVRVSFVFPDDDENVFERGEIDGGHQDRVPVESAGLEFIDLADEHSRGKHAAGSRAEDILARLKIGCLRDEVQADARRAATGYALAF